MKISIVVPVFNGEKYINKCLDSLINQTLKDIEIIVVDDGSTDKTKDIILGYNDSRIKYHYQENSGQSVARNNGQKLAKGDYVAFLDSDDYVTLDAYELLYSYALKTDSDITICSYYTVYSDHKERYAGDIYQESLKITNKEYLTFTPSPWNKLYKRSFLIESGFQFKEGIIYEDFCSIPLLILNNPRISYLDKSLIYYIQSENSTTRNTVYKKKYEDIFPAVKHLIYNLKNKGYDEELEYLLINHFLYQASLNFYRFSKYELIDRISDFMHEYYKNFKNNKYLKQMNFKQRILTYLFYYKKYNIIKLCQRIKRTI